MTQIGSTLPANNLQNFQVKCAGGFQISGSPLNPLNRSPFAKTTKTHLEKLLQKQQQIPKSAIIEGLKNLAGVWTEIRSAAAEEMSPRHLTRLQSLLSKSAAGDEQSPRNNLGSRWLEYHGRDDWAGMLDPLDENLRREVVRFGEFIQSAYHCFHHSPDHHVSLRDRSYRVTKSLYATASIGLPKWVNGRLVPEWMTQRTSWIGYVAVCDDLREIQRMGRRDIVIALRGTATCLEWAENFRDLLVPMETEQKAGAKVECGFLSLFRTRREGVGSRSLAETVVDEVKKLMSKYKGESMSITVTGHSLGAALALLVGDEVSVCAPDVPPVAVFSFGGPRVGNRSFAERLNKNNVKVLRIVNSGDVVTRVPGMFVSEELDRKLRGTTGGGKLLDALDNRMPWAYAHVGTQLRLDTKMSPFLKPDADAACCHDLEAYLHLVDGFLASNCPFRPNANRSLWRLLDQQRPNVKRLFYTSSSSTTTNCLPSPS